MKVEILFGILTYPIEFSGVIITATVEVDDISGCMFPQNDFFSLLTEVSMIMACLKYGQYFSQYDVRDIVLSIQEIKNSKMRLNYIEYTNSRADKREADITDYIAWMKAMARKGYAVMVIFHS